MVVARGNLAVAWLVAEKAALKELRLVALLDACWAVLRDGEMEKT